MTAKPIKDMATSVHRRLLNVARKSGRPFNELLQYYALERFLYRLSKSRYRDRFILKGALMLLVWKAPVSRPTRDVDLLGWVSNDPEGVRSIMTEIGQHAVEDDGLVFDVSRIVTETITQEAEYVGMRVTFPGYLGKARVAMQIDIGFGDVITPLPIRIVYPAILDFPNAELQGYNRETSVAEKFQAMTKLGILNSRMKDFFDIWLLSEYFEFQARPLADAIRHTFETRGLEVLPDPECFSARFVQDESKIAQWKGFIRKSRLDESPANFSQVVERVRLFLQPIAAAIAEDRPLAMTWPPGGAWQ